MIMEKGVSLILHIKCVGGWVFFCGGGGKVKKPLFYLQLICPKPLEYNHFSFRSRFLWQNYVKLIATDIIIIFVLQHNLRLILFVINKYFHEFSNSPRFQDLCQAGVKGLITAIDRFEPGRKLRLSTYGLFWIRHAIIRSITLSSFILVSFGLESV